VTTVKEEKLTLGEGNIFIENLPTVELWEEAMCKRDQPSLPLGSIFTS